MRVLILGGTLFLGRHLVESALRRGDEVTIFNRGQRNPGLFPEVTRLIGDRDGNLNALKGGNWDAVIDTCGYVPRIVSDSARLLADSVGHYTFISSISVYANQGRRNREDSPVGTLTDETVEQVTGEAYGPLKALCEQAAERAMDGRVLNIRPGLIVGPHDPSDRFTYWPARVARGGEVLAPGAPTLPVQIIDARDLADWALSMAEARQTGVYNATAPVQPYHFDDVLEACRQESGGDARFTWVEDAFLLERQVGPWMELPLWLPSGSDHSGMMDADTAKAAAAGLRQRPLAETVRDTLAWDRTRPADLERRAGMKPEREAELLAAWHSR